MTHSANRGRIMIPAILFFTVGAAVFFYVFFGGHLQMHSSGGGFGFQRPDSTDITRWDVMPQGDAGKTYSVFQDTGVWKLRMQNHDIVDADLKIVQRSLRHLTRFATAEHARLDKSKWKENGLDDHGTRVDIYIGKQVAATYIVSKLLFIDQYKSSYYIRPLHSDSVFLLKETYLEGSVISEEKNFRKREMTGVSPELFKNIKVISPDTNVYYVLEKIQGQWEISGQKLDQAKVEAYARMLSLIQAPEFTPQLTSTPPEASIMIETRYGNIRLTASKGKGEKWVMTSTANVGNRLELTRPQVDLVFPKMEFFLPQ